jgi:transcriptional regulator with XRE-family HTH domain
VTNPAVTARFASNLRTTRRRLELTQEALAHASGLHPTAIARLETGARAPSLGTLSKLARGLGVDAGELVEGI